MVARHQLALAVGGGQCLRLLAHHALQPLGRGLDGALVDVASNPAAAEFLGDGGGGARADKAVEDEVAGVGGRGDQPFQQGFGLLCRVL